MNTVLITLDKPLELKDKDGEVKQTIEEVTLREPEGAGELRNINILQLHMMNVDEYKKLLPRLTQPQLSAALVNQLKLSDLQKLMNEVIGFLAGIESED